MSLSKEKTMSNYLDPVILKYFPRQETPGVIPYVDRSTYLDQDQLPPMVWYRLVDILDFEPFEVDGKMFSLPMLDDLFMYIQSSVNRNHFPENMKPVQREWFTHVFPHCRRDCAFSFSTPDIELYAFLRSAGVNASPYNWDKSNFEKEMKVFKLYHKNPIPRNSSIPQQDWLLNQMDSQQRNELLVSDKNYPKQPPQLPGFDKGSGSPYHLWYPKPYLCGFSERDASKTFIVPTIHITITLFKIWYREMVTDFHENEKFVL